MTGEAASGTGSGRRPERPLVGRRAELRRILSALEAAAGGRGRCVLVAGEPGVGKTRLAQEVILRARARRARVIVGRCFEQHTAVPFFPFTEALAGALAVAGGDLQAVAADRWAELVHLVPELDRAAPTLDASATQLGVFRAATDFLRTLAESRPLVILLDDLHWADATSLGLLLYLGRHLASARILILGTYREAEIGAEHPLDETLRELVRDRLADEIRLPPLSLHETAGLIRTQLATRHVSDALVALIHGRAEGNPFFTEELLKALVEQGGVVEVEAGARERWELTPRARTEVPRSVRSAVGHRVSRLPPETQDVLRLASVVGQDFDLEVLVEASEQPEAVVLGQLDAALSARLLLEPRGGRAGQYGFVHALVQETLYAELPSSQRRRLHRRVGEALEARQPGRPSMAARPPMAAQLARHFLAAGDHRRAVRYAIEAGAVAASHYAHAEAVRHYQAAVELLVDQGDEARAADLQCRLASELYDLNQLADALACYQVALSTFTRLGDTIGQARVYRGLGRVDSGRYDMASAVRHFETALRLWPAERADAELGGLLYDAAGAHADLFSDYLVRASALAERALLLAQRGDDASLLARSLALVTVTRMQRDPRPQATNVPLDEAERVARAAGDWRAVCRVHLGRADYCELGGEQVRALAERRRAVEAAERSGDTERLAFAWYNVADTCLWAGYWDEGRRAGRSGLDLDPHGLLQGWPGRVFVTWMEGRPQAAVEQMRNFIAEARQHGDLQGVAVGLVRLAQYALQLERLAEADRAAREAVEFLRVGGRWRPYPGCVYGPLAESAVRLDAADATDILAVAEQAIAATEQWQARPQLLRAQGLLLQRQGKLDAALEALTASAAIDRREHDVLHLGRTLTALAQVARQAGDARSAAEADAELVQLVDGVGPEVRALPWARRVAQPAASGAGAPGVGGGLTRRETEVLRLVAGGGTNREIAERLTLSVGTVERHLANIYTKIGARGRAEAAAFAVTRGLLAER